MPFWSIVTGFDADPDIDNQDTAGEAIRTDCVVAFKNDGTPAAAHRTPLVTELIVDMVFDAEA